MALRSYFKWFATCTKHFSIPGLSCMNKTKYQDSETDVEENASISGHLHHGKRKCNGNKVLNY